MDTRAIGPLAVTVVGIGCNNFGGRLDLAGTRAVVGAALDAGVTFFDTADIYGGTRSEEFLGQALGARRDDVVIATKFGMAHGEEPGGGAPGYVKRSVEASLRRLGTDRIDLYQLHRPDPDVPVADTLGALDDLVRAGTVRAIGCSNFSADQLAEAEAAAAGSGPRGGPGARFLSVQNQYSILHREPERGVLQVCERDGLAFLPFYPLANGLLTGKYRPGAEIPANTRLGGDKGRRRRELSEERLATVARLEQLGAAHGLSLLELAFGWLLAHGAVASVIAGAMTPEQVRANAAAGAATVDAALAAAVDDVVGPGTSE